MQGHEVPLGYMGLGSDENRVPIIGTEVSNIGDLTHIYLSITQSSDRPSETMQISNSCYVKSTSIEKDFVYTSQKLPNVVTGNNSNQ